ncbi:hypothetical protein Tco_1505083 [Tanacetum coccineum]
MGVNNLYQPWRAILSMINQCLTSKTSGHDRPRYPVLQMLWGIITSTNVDYAKLMWEEFVQAIQTFLTDKANLGSPTKKGRKDKPHVIPYCRFTKLIIFHLGRTHNIHQRSASLFHLAEEDLRLNNLKFVSKGEDNEVFGMLIPNELILNNIRNAPYYNAYLEMLPKPKPAKEKSSKPAPALKPKITREKPAKPSPAKPLKMGEEYDVERAIQVSLELFQAQSQAYVGGVAIQEPDDTSANIVRETPSPADAETCADTDKTNSGGDTKILQMVQEQQRGKTLDNTIRIRIRYLFEADMKEILHQRMFKSGSYKLLHEHVTLYEALEASIE